MKPLPILLVAALAATVPFRSAQAAESLEGCTGYLDWLPNVIAEQGVWCLRKDLEFSTFWEYGIRIAASNVTLDCNGYGIRHTGAGMQFGIRATFQSNITIRNCRIENFDEGIVLEDGGGHLVERNLLRGILVRGMLVEGDGNLIRGNRVLDTGGLVGLTSAVGIDAHGDIVDNVVHHVEPDVMVGAVSYGIVARAPGAVVRDNVVRGIYGSGQHRPILLDADGQFASGNHVVTGDEAGVDGIHTTFPYASYCQGNTSHGFTNGVNCTHKTGNLAD